MVIRALNLVQFRNHADSRIAPTARFNLLVGDNGAGKTNVLEALSLLAPGRGMRGAALDSMPRQRGDGGFAIAATLGQEDVTLGTGITPDAPRRRSVRINGVTASAHGLSEWLALAWLTPAMDRLFLESAGGRRRFLDRLVLALEPAHARHAARYEAAMRERNRLLGGERAADPIWLDALEARMAEHGSALAAARRSAVEALEHALEGAAQTVFARPSLALSTEHDPQADDLAQLLRRQRPRDQAAGRTLVGPHRADLLVSLRQKNQPAALCSTGEQKAMLIAIILAHADLVAARRSAPLVLLLDEIAAHLDPLRRAALYEQLASRPGQVWMTGTDEALFDGVPMDNRVLYRVTAGQVALQG